MASNGEIIEESRVVLKYLCALPLKFDYLVVIIEESKGISSFSIEDLQKILKIHEIHTNKRYSSNTHSSTQDQVFQSQVNFLGGVVYI